MTLDAGMVCRLLGCGEFTVSECWDLWFVDMMFTDSWRVLEFSPLWN